MNITLDNIEAWLLDLSEGNLSAAQEKEVRAFLKQHPELMFDVENLGVAPSVEPAIENNTDWTSLKKENGWNRLQDDKINFLIGKLEGTLTTEEEIELNNLLLNNSDLANEWKVYRQIKLAANTNERSSLLTFLKQSNLTITKLNCTEIFIVAAETNDENLIKHINTWLVNNPTFVNEWEIANQLTLVASLAERMPFKENLKKKERQVAFLYTRRFYVGMAAAAMLTLFFGWKWFSQPGDKIKMAKKENSITIQPENKQDIIPIPNNVASNLPIAVNKSNVLNKTIKKLQRDSVTINSKKEIKELPIIENKNIVRFDVPKKDTLLLKIKEHNPVTEIAFYKDTLKQNQNLYTEANPNFTTMKNAISRVSNGFIEVDRKKNDESKEFYLKIGKLKFQRKKKIEDL